MSKRKKFLKITAGILGITLLVFLLFALNSFVGNPISAAIAEKRIEQYVVSAYPNMEFTMGEVSYNFKFGDYGCFIQSKTSPDTAFRVSVRKGKIKDNYEWEVANKYTTFRRMDSEFDQIIDNLVANEFPYDTRLVGGHLRMEKMDEDNPLELDMLFDPYNIPTPTEVTVWTSSEEISYEVAAKRLIELDEIMETNNISVDFYSISIEKPYTIDKHGNKRPCSGGKNISIFDFPKEKINSDNLADVLREHEHT